MEMTESDAILRIFLSLFLGSLIGLEREFSHQSAGLRTHILVCLGSTVFTIISISSVALALVPPDVHQSIHYTINRDPGRIAAQIVSGIGFIGGGAVLRHGASVRGLTTAASLWMIASIGMLAGFGFYRLSLVSTLVAFLVLFTIGHLERSYFHKHLKTYNRLRIQVTAAVSQQYDIQDWVEKRFGKDILSLKTVASETEETVTYTYVINAKRVKLNLNDLSRNINALQGVVNSSIKIYLEDNSP
jgi:putative Mg2+ transporter-C (MgtC) family protein